MVDKCKYCDFKNVYTCNECEGSYYLVTFYGTEKGKNYHACWKKMWLYLALWCLLYCPCLYGLCCYALYRKAQTVINAGPVSGGVEIQKKVEVPAQAKNNLVNVQPTNSAQLPVVNVQNNSQYPPAPINMGQSTTRPIVDQNYPAYGNQSFQSALYDGNQQLQQRGPIRSSLGYLSPSRQLAQYNPGQNLIQTQDLAYSAPVQRIVRRMLPEASTEASPTHARSNIRIIEKDPTLIIERSPEKNGHSYHPLGGSY